MLSRFLDALLEFRAVVVDRAGELSDVDREDMLQLGAIGEFMSAPVEGTSTMESNMPAGQLYGALMRCVCHGCNLHHVCCARIFWHRLDPSWAAVLERIARGDVHGPDFLADRDKLVSLLQHDIGD
eukprot:346357-Chlamydomonas_euryale.AAC.1